MSGITAAELSNHADAVFILPPPWMTRSAKRIFDIGMSVALLVALLPLIVLILCLLKLLDRGPFLYCHSRVGQGGRPFRCIKFRTMRPDADVRLQELLQANPQMRAQWTVSGKLKCDPRVTRLGRLLRKTSLDELPQVINVLRGDMSLVGPRPVVQSEIDLHYHGAARAAYLAVKPGITGPWQVSGRSDASYVRRVELDTEYVHNLSFISDLVLLLRTVSVIFSCRGAY